MIKFAIERMGELKGDIPFYKLFIDGNCQINEFEEEISKSSTHYSECKTLLSYMDYLSNGGRPPKVKYKILKTSKNTKCTCFEFKGRHVRYYGYIDSCGSYIVCFACKNDKSEQKLDISRLETLLGECTEFFELNRLKDEKIRVIAK
jgi:hypothetical protein